ncbi:YciI family protein [Celeribacter sp.]|uniref:YciI family protein n=1 Tax=Celeribacter sp. TaxID=1890673 RepID=UPI003A93B5B0
MKFALICKDKTGALDIRKANRDAHLAYIGDTGVVEQAGPFLDAGGEMCGSLVILNVDDPAAAEAWAENDPYAKAGLFESVDIQAWKKVIGA